MITERLQFRIWLKDKKRMSYKSIYNISNTEAIKFCSDSDYIIMQCTGLRDKNGNLIYEGDIVSEKFAHGYPIEYYEKYYEVIWLERYVKFLPRVLNRDDFGDPLFFAQCDIIGNIYENPELLKGAMTNER